MIHRRYFLVTGGPLMAAAEQLRGQRSDAWERMADLQCEYGAENFVLRRGQLVGLIFSDPPGKGWLSGGSTAEGYSFYKPDKRTHAGRKIHERFRHERIPDISEAFDHVGLGGWMIVDGKSAYYPTAGDLMDHLVLIVPEGDRETNLRQVGVEHYQPAEGLREITYMRFAELQQKHEANRAANQGDYNA